MHRFIEVRSDRSWFEMLSREMYCQQYKFKERGGGLP